MFLSPELRNEDVLLVETFSKLILLGLLHIVNTCSSDASQLYVIRCGKKCLIGVFPKWYANSVNSGNLIIAKGIDTPSVKRQRQRQGPIGMHCDAPKSVPDPFPSVNPSVKTSKLPLDA